MNDKILAKIKIGSRCLVRDVRNFEWNVWCEATVMKHIETSKSQSIQVVYTDLKGDIQKVTSCLIGGIVKAHDSDIAHALSLMLY